MIYQYIKTSKKNVQTLLEQILYDKMLWNTNLEVAAAYAISISELFDANWYLKQYPDVAEENIDPILHYVRFGAKEKRNPNSWFNNKYIEKYESKTKREIPPFLIYIYYKNQKDNYLSILENYY